MIGLPMIVAAAAAYVVAEAISPDACHHLTLPLLDKVSAC